MCNPKEPELDCGGSLNKTARPEDKVRYFSILHIGIGFRVYTSKCCEQLTI